MQYKALGRTGLASKDRRSSSVAANHGRLSLFRPGFKSRLDHSTLQERDAALRSLRLGRALQVSPMPSFMAA